jgi:hypothetical protein
MDSPTSAYGLKVVVLETRILIDSRIDLYFLLVRVPTTHGGFLQAPQNIPAYRDGGMPDTEQERMCGTRCLLRAN